MDCAWPVLQTNYTSPLHSSLRYVRPRAVFTVLISQDCLDNSRMVAIEAFLSMKQVPGLQSDAMDCIISVSRTHLHGSRLSHSDFTPDLPNCSRLSNLTDAEAFIRPTPSSLMSAQATTPDAISIAPSWTLQHNQLNFKILYFG